MKKIMMSILFAIACVGLCAGVELSSMPKKFLESPVATNLKYELFNEVNSQLLAQLDVKEVLKEYEVTDEKVENYRNAFSSSEDDRASEIRDAFRDVLYYDMDKAQKDNLQKELEEALAYNKRIYNDDAFVKGIIRKKAESELKERLASYKEDENVPYRYLLSNKETGKIYSNEKAYDEKSAYTFDFFKGDTFYLGADTYGEELYNYLPLTFKKYEGTIYIPKENKKRSAFYAAEKNYNDSYRFVKWVTIAGALAFIAFIALWVSTRKTFKVLPIYTEIQLFITGCIALIGLWLGAICYTFFTQQTTYNTMHYAELACYTLIAALFIYVLLLCVQSFVKMTQQKSWKRHSWLGKNRASLQNAFYVPQHSFGLLFTWLAFFLAGVGLMIVVDFRYAFFVTCLYIFLWLVVMIPVIVLAWRHMAKVNSVIRQGQMKEPVLDGTGALEQHSKTIYALQQGITESVNEKQKSERMKTELITNVSHDLRTPLTALVTYTDLLKNSNLTEEERNNYVGVIDQKTQKLKTLIDDLFEVSKMASGQFELHKSTLDYVELLKQLVGEYEDMATAQQLTIRLDCDVDSQLIDVDGAKWARMIDNLIGNAIKYSTPNTRIHIQLRDGNLIIKNVTAFELPENIDELMNRFTRGDASRHTEGSGLGLAIAQSIANLHESDVVLSVDGDLFKVVVCAPPA